jgi:predicted lipoprotein with Yx(FWY)xxD motif
MRSPKRGVPALALAALAILAIVIAGCGSSNDSSSTSASSGGGGGLYGGGGSSKPASAPASSGGSGMVAVSNNPKLGKIIVDSKGNTLYYFEKDKQNSGASTCSGACAQVWPPYTASGKPQASKGAAASKLGTIKRSDGTTEVTYNGWPLYTYAGDKKPGDTNGNDFSQFGAQWYALTPAGVKPPES